MKKLLVVCDCQKDMFSRLTDLSAEKNICALIEKMREDADIIFTLDSHDESYALSAESAVDENPHCLVNTEGWQLYGDIAGNLTTADTVFIKPVYGSLELGNHIKETGYDEITLCGLMTSGAVFANAVIARCALTDAHVKIISNACADCDSSAAKNALNAAAKIGVEILLTEDM